MEGGRSLTLPKPTEQGSPWDRRLAARWRAIPRWDSLFERTEACDGRILAGIGWRTALVDWSFIFVLVLLYCLSFLSLGTQRMLPGPESENFQSLDILLVRSLADFGQFPLWNPWLHSGAPAVGDPFTHIYNPLSTIPELLVGVRDGFKIGLFLSFVSGGLGMWWLGAVLGVGRMTRLWMALMYAFTGQPAARFFQGEYDFTLGAAWIPWFLASALAALRTRRRLHVAMASASAVMIFFSGNSQYSYYLLFVTAVLGGAMIVNLRRRMPFVTFDMGKVKALVAIAVLAAGLAAVALLPALESYPRISKATDPTGVSAHTIQQILLDYTSSDASRPDTWKIMPDGGKIPLVPREEYYDYTGIAPFLALLLLPLAYRRERRRTLLFFFLVLALVVAFVDVTQMPWADLYRQNYLLNQFRFHQRILIYGTCALLALAGLGIDAMVRLLRKHSGIPGNAIKWGVRPLLASVGIGLLAVFVVWSVADVYSVNRKLLGTEDRDPAIGNILAWLRGYDAGEYYTSYPGDSYYAFFTNRMRFFDGHYGFTYVRQEQGQLNRRPVEARPKYQILANDRRPDNRDAVLVRQFEKHSVYQLPHSLPFAFLVRNETLLDPAGGKELQAEGVSPVTPYIPGPNGVEVIAQAEQGSTLVVLQTRAPGWQATVDGRPREMKNVGGYLALDAEPGTHKYVFTFGSTGFATGLAVTILSLLLVFGLAIADARADWRLALARLRTLPRSVASWGRFAVEPLYVGIAAARRGPSKWLRTAELPDGGERWLWKLGLILGQIAAVVPLEWALFGAAMLVYAVTRLWALDRFPIYFFTDEAYFPVTASELISRGFRDGQGKLFPIYFEAAGQRWTPVLPVYLHALSVVLFGKSIVVTRATSAIVGMLGVAAVALLLKLVFRARFWWLGALVMASIPAWFLHSRTAFETTPMTSFYGCFLLFYLLYRTRSPRYLFAALPVAAATFYSYSNAQGIVAATAVLLLVSDFRYHLQQWRTMAVALLVGVVLALPLIGFQRDHPAGVEEHLRAINSYWLTSAPLTDKLGHFAQTYGYGLSPQYWFFPNDHDIVRHRMKDFGYILTWMLPLALIGIGLCLWRVRSAPHRTVLLAALAAPAGAAVYDVGITRVLAFVIPAGLFITLGVDVLLERVPRRVSSSALALGVLALLSLVSLNILRQALNEGPMWYRDYGLYGMQWGAQQIFEGVVPEYLKRDSSTRVVVSHSWANGADRYLSFFVPPDQWARVSLANIDYYMLSRQDLTPDTVLIMTPAEYEKARTSPKFKSVQAEELIPYPDGTPGFYVARLSYADNLDSIIAAEKEARRKLVESQVMIDSQLVRVRNSLLDMGNVQGMFDGDRHTLGRGMEANPFVLELYFPEPRPVTGLLGYFGATDIALTASLYAPGSDKPVVYQHLSKGTMSDLDVQVPFQNAPSLVSWMRLELKNVNTGEPANIHIFELKLLK